MSTSTKTPASIRQGGPGSAHENAKAPLEIKKPAQSDLRRRSTVSGGGGERDSHHSRSARMKGAKSDS